MRKCLNKVLIIKTGYSETLVPQYEQRCSLGDVFRTTVILHLYKGDHVTWLTDQKAIPLLEDNPYIDRLFAFESSSISKLKEENFDIVINLEKSPEISSLCSKINARQNLGFQYGRGTATPEALYCAHETPDIVTIHNPLKRGNSRNLNEILFSMLGAKWNGESYILGYKPKSNIRYDLGFNVKVGEKFPVKAWPEKNWRQLERLINGKYSVTCQQHLNDLKGYMDWINSCNVLITNDSLGLHIGLALGKKVIALIGPSSTAAFPQDNNLYIITPTIQRDCIPCLNPDCRRDDTCMNYISPEGVMRIIEDIV